MGTAIFVVAVAAVYIALGGVSSALAYTPSDAWTVWLASGTMLGLLLACRRERRAAILGGAALGAALFSVLLDDVRPLDALGYAAIEVLAAFAGLYVFGWISPLPTRLERPRDLAALVVGALAMSVVGAVLAAAWSAGAGTDLPARTFRVWTLSNMVGTIVMAPLVIAWAGFRVKRSGGLTMTEFAAGAVVAVLFFATLRFLFGAGVVTHPAGHGPTYLPVMFMALIALLWGGRGATLAALLATLLALYYTAEGRGPFARSDEFLGDPELEVQGYTATMALTGLLIAVLEAGQRRAMLVARDWRTRFEAAIGAHRLVAYEWDPASGSFAVTGDTRPLLAIAPETIGSLADWLAHVAPDERDRVATAFALRADGGPAAPITYRVKRPDGEVATLTDEASAIRDHDGALHRITGIIHVAA